MKHPFKDSLTFQTEVTINTEKICDLLENAQNNQYCPWIRYYSDDIFQEAKKFDGEKNIVKLIMLGGSLPVYDSEEEELVRLGVLNVLDIIRALQAMALGEDLKGVKNNIYKKHFNDFVTDNDDAITVDVIMQIAIMGAVVFG